MIKKTTNHKTLLVIVLLFLIIDFLSAQPITRGSSWKYNATGINPDSSWHNAAYNDSLWLTGNALFGYGSISAEAIVTTISYGSNSSNKYPSYYFRKTFDYIVTGTETNFEVNALIDDGAVFYINGVEVKRLNMPSGIITYNTLASSDGNESSYQQFFIPASAIQNGSNIIAVEVHQSSLSSSDIGFNMEIIAHTGAINITPNTSTINQIHFGSLDLPLNGLTITWHNAGLSDSIKWGYDTAYLSGKYAGIKRNNYSNYLYDYTFPNLLKDTVIHYSFWDSNTLGWTPDKVFYSAKEKDADHFNFNALGDSRTNLSDWNTISNAVRPSDFVLFGGDLVNSGGSTTDWDGWFANGKNFLEKNLVYYNTGNHDVNSDASASNFRNFMVLPSNPGNELYYSFTVGNSIFICLNSNDPGNTVQYNWLINTLENNKDKKWRIVFFHKPFFTSPSHVGEMDAYIPTWWKAFDDYGVEVIFNGHTHNYQRSKPININISTNSGVSAYGHCSNNGRCQIVAGSAGAPSVSAGTGWFIAKSLDIMHYVNVTVEGDTLNFKTYDFNNAIIDSFMIYKALDIKIKITDTIFCTNDTVKVILNASGGSGDNIKWFTDSCGGNSIDSGNLITIPVTDSNSTYFATRETSGVITYCASISLNKIINLSDSTSFGTISAIEINSCGDTNFTTIPFTFKTLPETAGVISGPDTVCAGQNQVVYKVVLNPNTTLYNWTLPNGANGNSISDSIIVNYENNAISGDITVKTYNTCGESPASTFSVIVNSIPDIAGNILGLDSINQGQHNVVYTIPEIPTTASYIWTLPVNVQGNSTSNTIELNFTDSSLSGNILVKAVNECGEGLPSTRYITILKQLNVTLFLEGLYLPANLLMTQVKDENGNHFQGNISDTLKISLYGTQFPYPLVYSFPNTEILQNGMCSLKLPAELNDSYYLAIQHRNHLETWSSTPISFAHDTIDYDFTIADNKAYGTNLKQIAPGVYAILVGDINKDGVVDISDLIAMDSDITNGTLGYIISDLNGDGIVDISDLITIDENIINGVVMMKP